MDPSSRPNTITIDIPLDEHGTGILTYKLPNTLRMPRTMNLDVNVVSCILPNTSSTTVSNHQYAWQLMELDVNNNRLVTDFPPHTLNGFFTKVSDMWEVILHSDVKLTIRKDEGGLICRQHDVAISPSSCIEGVYRNGMIYFNHEGGKNHMKTDYVQTDLLRFVFTLVCSPELCKILTGRDGTSFNFLMHNLDDPFHTVPDSFTRLDYQPLIQHVYMENLDRGMVNGRLRSLLFTRHPQETSLEFTKKHFKRLNPQYEDGKYACWDELRFYVEDGTGTKLFFTKGVFHLVLELRWTQSGRMLREAVSWRDVWNCGGVAPSRRMTKNTH